MIAQIPIRSTKEFELLDIGEDVRDLVEDSGVKEGLCTVYIPHATAAILINENADPNICLDFLDALDKAIPLHAGYRHDRIDNNGAAHIKAAIVGPSETIPIHEGKLTLGTWQDIMVADFDGPKNRKVFVKILKG